MSPTPRAARRSQDPADSRREGQFLSAELGEKVALHALLCGDFARILPEVAAPALQVAVGVAAIVIANAAVSPVYVRRRGAGIESAALRFAALLVLLLLLLLLNLGSPSRRAGT